MSKGSKRRPTLVSREQEDLQWALALGEITFKQYEERRKQLIREGKWKT
jgi:hypothetical protein